QNNTGLDKEAAKKRRAALAERLKIKTLPATTLVMRERPTTAPLSTILRQRGNYRRLGPSVTAAVPEQVHPWPKDQPLNRLGLARWLTDPAHPLTGRVAVNRAWQQFFGRGLVETSEDFGTEGARPTHPDLLDWLATEFTGIADSKSGTPLKAWSMK